MEYLAEFALFFAKAITLLAGIVIAILAIASAGQKGKKQHKGHLEVTPLNEHFHQMKESLQQVLLSKDELKQLGKEEKKKNSKKKKAETSTPRVFVLDFHGDIKASGVKSLREEITAILSLSRPGDEVVVRLESAGGMVHAYGLAASQLCRIRNRGIRLTIAVDKVAASGGYMMACTADHIIAAPFAVIGSIGVMAQLPNFSRLLKKHDVDLELHTAGEYKRTLTVFGENTEKGREKFKQDIEDTHDLFKDFIKEYRNQVDIEKVSTGEIWYGQQAITMQLVDELMTSDEYLGLKAEQADVVQVSYVLKKGMADRLGIAAHGTLDAIVLKWLERLQNGRFF